jgi:hypothetical protein
MSNKQLPLTTPAPEVSKLAPTTINRFAFGVRFAPQFGLLDKSGQLIDMILRTQGTPFGPEIFPLTQSSPTERILLDEDKNIHLTHQDVVLQWQINTRNFARIESLGTEFQDFVLEPLRQIGKLEGITRYGILIHLSKIKVSSLKYRPIDHYLTGDFSNADTLAMRFTRKLASEEALVKKRVEDYRNVIYTLSENEGLVNMSIDYQEYFKPALDNKEWGDKTFLKFMRRGVGYFMSDFQRWFQEVVGMPEVA